MITERLKHYIRHYQLYGFKRFIRYSFKERPLFYRIADDQYIYILWNFPSLFVIKINDLMQISGYKSLWFKLFIRVRNYQSYADRGVLYALFLIYPFIELYYILNKRYYKLAIYFFKKGYLKAEEGSLIPRFWFIDIIKQFRSRNGAKRSTI